MARAARAAEQANRRAQRERERHARTYAREEARYLKQAAREDAIAYREMRESEAAELTAEVAERVALLQNVLNARPRAAAVNASTARDPEAACRRAFAALRPAFETAPFAAPADLGARPTPPDQAKYRTVIPAPSFFGRLFGGAARHAAKVAQSAAADAARLATAQARYAAAAADWAEQERQARTAHDAAEAKREQEARELAAGVDAWEQGVREQDPEAVVQYLSHVLDSSDYPEEFDEQYEASYSPEARVLTLEYVLPGPDVVPAVREYSYVRAKDEVREKARPRSEMTAIYRSLVAALSLRTLRELFAAAPEECLEAVTFHGVVEATDPATGADARRCLVSARVTRAALAAVQFGRVDPTACLVSLDATVSKKPEDLAPVRRVDEGGRVDVRYVSSKRVVA